MLYFIFDLASFEPRTQKHNFQLEHTHKQIPQITGVFYQWKQSLLRESLSESRWSMEKEDRTVSFQTTQMFWGDLILFPQPHLQGAASLLQPATVVGAFWLCAAESSPVITWASAADVQADMRLVSCSGATPHIWTTLRLETGGAAEPQLTSVLLTNPPRHWEFPS